MTELVLVLCPDSHISVEDILAVDAYAPDDIVVFWTASEVTPPPEMRAILVDGSSDGLDVLERWIDRLPVKAIVVRAGGYYLLSRSLLSSIYSKSLPKVLSIREGVLSNYDFPIAESGKEVLFVYPGSFAPTTNGSRQRALDLVFSLIEDGVKLRVVIPREKGIWRLAAFLEQFGAKVELFNLGRLRFLVDAARKVSKYMKGGKYYLPYFARLRISLSMDYRRVLRRNMPVGGVAVFSYAWMYPLFFKKASNVQFFVDTHDVNYIRDQHYYTDDKIVSKFLGWFNRRLEVHTLDKADRVIAISDADRLHLLPSIRSPITVLEPSFGWIAEPHEVSAHKSLSFGFIGANMVANRLAIDEIIEKIWPAILKDRPRATLYVAGNICDYLNGKECDKTNIVALGFVGSLRSFFSRIDGLLSPVLMEGGLNFKILESLIAGVPVLVNSRVKHLESRSPALLAYSDHSDIVRFLELADSVSMDAGSKAVWAQQVRERQRDKFKSGLQDLFG